MLRPDCEKFLKICETELNPNYVLQEKDPASICFYTKIIDTKSEIIRDNSPNWKIYKYRGIYLDVFPMEHCSAFWARIAGQIGYYLAGRWVAMRSKSGFIRAVVDFNMVLLKKLIFPAIRALQVFTPKNSMAFSMGIGALNPRKFDEVFPLKEYEFEGRKFFGPNDMDAYLTRLYSNYMDLPSLDKIQRHSSRVIFFDDNGPKSPSR